MRITQISESKQLGILLALSGGFMDAYSYIQRGHVFANAQTGNMLLFGINLSQLKFLDALQYAIPVIAFTLGIALAEQLRACQWKKLHWRQIALIIETTILISVAFFNSDLAGCFVTSTFYCDRSCSGFFRCYLSACTYCGNGFTAASISYFSGKPCSVHLNLTCPAYK